MATTVPNVPTLSDVAVQAAALLDQLEALIPGYTQPDPARVRTVTINARFAQELITPTIAAINNYEPLRQHNLFDGDRARRALLLRDELRPVEQRVLAIAAALGYTIDSQLADAGIEALQAYRWAQHHVRHQGSEGLRPYVDEMSSVVKKTIGRRKTKASAPQAPKAPKTPQTPQTPQTPTTPQKPQGLMADLMAQSQAVESDEPVTA